MLSNLETISDQELQAEITRRQILKENQEKQKRLEKVKLVLKHKDALLELMNHSRTSCDNYNNAIYHPYHGGAECHKCCLEDLTERDDIQIDIDIRLTKIHK